MNTWTNQIVRSITLSFFSVSLQKDSMIKQRIAKVKQHINENKKVYIAAAGASAITVVVMKTRTTQIINTVAPVFNNYVIEVKD